MLHPFHLAINVHDLDEARSFYGGVLGCTEGRSTQTWVDYDFFGHQLSLHIGPILKTENTGHVGEHLVPMPHFGLALPLTGPRWRDALRRLRPILCCGLRFVFKGSRASNGRCFSVTQAAIRSR
mgnify:CR=1 FL=1